MSKHIACLSIAAALLAGSVLPAAAADLYGYEGGPPLAFHSRDDITIDGGRARIERREDVRPAGYGERRGPGPVVFDERGPEHRFVGRYGGADLPPPYGPAPRFGYGGPPPFAPRFARPVAAEAGYGYGYRPAGFAPPAFERRYGGPDAGCTTEQARSVTPAGWEKTVTHRTCYRR